MKKKKIVKAALSLFLILTLLLTSVGCTDVIENPPEESNRETSTDKTEFITNDSKEVTESQADVITSIPKTITQEDLVRIFEIREKVVDSLGFVHNNIITDSDIKVENPKATDFNSVCINGVDYDITYKNSKCLFYSDDVPYDEYAIEDKGSVAFKNGELVGIYYVYAKIDIDTSLTNDQILKPIKDELAKTFDMSQYNDEDFTCILLSSKIDRYFAYFYKVVDGYHVERLCVKINNTGEIYSIEKLGFQTDFEWIEIDSELEKKALELKMKDIYGDAYQSYSYITPFSLIDPKIVKPTLVSYKGKIHICYYVEVNLFANGKNSRCINKFIIPLDMISNG